jgi:hypothetical protein
MKSVSKVMLYVMVALVIVASSCSTGKHDENYPEDLFRSPQ